MTASERRTVQVTRRFAFSPERVFDAWLAPEKARLFLFATPDGEMIRTEIDARVGGRFIITELRDGQEAEHTGQYLEIDRPRRLVFSFGDTQAFDATTVTIEVTPTPGGCELVLTHEGVGAEWLAQTTTGWTGILEGLERAMG